MISGALKTDEGETGWQGPGQFRSWDNNASSAEPAVIEAVTTFDAANGATYDISLEVSVGVGVSSIGQAKQSVRIDILHGGVEEKLVWINATAAWEENIEGYTNQYTWDGSYHPYSGSIRAASDGPVTVRYRFTLEPTLDVNDDIWIRELQVTQASCAA